MRTDKSTMESLSVVGALIYLVACSPSPEQRAENDQARMESSETVKSVGPPDDVVKSLVLKQFVDPDTAASNFGCGSLVPPFQSLNHLDNMGFRITRRAKSDGRVFAIEYELSNNCYSPWASQPPQRKTIIFNNRFAQNEFRDWEIVKKRNDVLE